MNLFDDAQWLNISDFKKLDDDSLNYIDYIYNEFPNLYYTDDEWVNIIKRGDISNNKDISNFMKKYAKLYIGNSININISMCIFIKYNTDRLKNIIKKLSIKQIYYILANVDLIESIFAQKHHIKSLKYPFNMDEQLYQQYIHIRIINPIKSTIISYLLSKYPNDDLTDFYRFIDDFLVDFYNKQNYINVFDEIDLISNEYVQKMQPFAHKLYDYYVQRFIMNPDRLMLKFLLNYNIKLIYNEDALKIIDFVKNEKGLLNKVIEKIISSCNLTNKQIDELKSYQLLSNI